MSRLDTVSTPTALAHSVQQTGPLSNSSAYIGYIAVYLLVLFVAFVTSGHELLQQPGAWYAAIAPLVYVGAARAYASRMATRRRPASVAVALHAAVAPAVVFSFLGLGLLLPVFAVLWWLTTRDGVGVAG